MTSVGYRTLGRTGLRVSDIGFGCGGTAGLMIRGEPDEQRATVRRALDMGIEFFDTSPLYGDGASERNLGRVLHELGAAPLVSTKLDLREVDLVDVGAAAEASVRQSLRRLGREFLDVLVLHNRVGRRRDMAGRVLSTDDVLGDGGVADVMASLQNKGLVTAIGFTGLGHTAPVLEVVASGRFDVMQGYINLLNPSGVIATPAAWRSQDYEQAITRAIELGIGVVGIRAVAVGALSDREDLHPLAKSYSSLAQAEVDADRVLARAARALIPAHYPLARYALRYALSVPGLSSVLVGVSERSHLDEALTASAEGPLDEQEIARLHDRFNDLYEMA